MLLQIPDFEISTEIIDDENLIGHLTEFGKDIILKKEISFDQDAHLARMTLIEKQTELLITDWKRSLQHLHDFDGKILKPFNPNNILKIPVGVCVVSDSKEEKIFVGDYELHKIFVFNSNFDLKFQFDDQNLTFPDYMQIDNEFDKSRLYVPDSRNNEMTMWNTSNGLFIAKIDIDSPNQIHFTQNSLFLSRPVFERKIKIIK